MPILSLGTSLYNIKPYIIKLKRYLLLQYFNLSVLDAHVKLLALIELPNEQYTTYIAGANNLNFYQSIFLY